MATISYVLRRKGRKNRTDSGYSRAPAGKIAEKLAETMGILKILTITHRKHLFSAALTLTRGFFLSIHGGRDPYTDSLVSNTYLAGVMSMPSTCSSVNPGS